MNFNWYRCKYWKFWCILLISVNLVKQMIIIHPIWFLEFFLCWSKVIISTSAHMLIIQTFCSSGDDVSALILSCESVSLCKSTLRILFGAAVSQFRADWIISTNDTDTRIVSTTTTLDYDHPVLIKAKWSGMDTMFHNEWWLFIYRDNKVNK